MRKRVVVTGLGVISPLGNTVGSFWDNALKGANGIAKIDRFDVSDLTVKIAGQVRDFDPTKALDAKEVRRTDPNVHYAMGAAREALADCGIELAKLDPYRIGVVMGTGIGGIIEIQDGGSTLALKGPGRMSPFFIPKLMPNAASAQIAIQFGVRGVNFTPTSACAASNHAVGTALRHIQCGDADVIFTGGSEAPVSRLAMGGFCAARAMAANRNDDPEHASRPFDKDRSGFVMGEGAGVMVLEELEHAKARGARIYCEVVGYGATDDAYHITAPSEDGAGATVCMTQAMKDGGLTPDDIGYVNAHGTSTELNDKTESLAIRNALGAVADRIGVSSTKSMIGHLLGGSGGIELIACIKSLETGWCHPTRNWTTRDPDCPLDYIAGDARQLKPKATLKNSFGFGGHNASIAMRRWDGK